jgi:hypothetical protein
VTVFECVANNHCCDCKKTECGKHVHGPDSVRKSRKSHWALERICRNGWRNIAIALKMLETGVLSVTACFRQSRRQGIAQSSHAV